MRAFRETSRPRPASASPQSPAWHSQCPQRGGVVYTTNGQFSYSEVNVLIVNLSDEYISTTAIVELLTSDGYVLDINSYVPLDLGPHDTGVISLSFGKGCSYASYVRVIAGPVSVVAPLH